jgi:phosphoenolpyruvate carboxylase
MSALISLTCLLTAPPPSLPCACVHPLLYPRRRIDTALANIGQPRLPLHHRLFDFGSWMGGDRDGNPNVIAETTRDVVVLARWV